MQEVFAGVDVGGTRIKIGLADRLGRLVSCEVRETEAYFDSETLLETVAAEIKTQANAAGVRVVAAGVGCPGRIDFTSGTVVWLRSKLEFLEGIPLAPRLSDRLRCPVVCDNDVNTILAGELRFGAGQSYHDVIAVTVGTGIGGAFAVGGRVVRGRNSAAGHFGYMSHDPHGVPHICGNTGIVEEHASQSGILRQLGRALDAGEASSLTESLVRGKEPGLRELFDAADAGDLVGRRLADRLTYELGVLIANLVYALDPELVLIGGGIVNHRPHILDDVRREVEGRIAYLPQGATRILRMTLGDAAGVLGGATLAMDASTQTREGLRARGEER